MTETVMVTGANRGIGLEFARQYAAEGYRVIACCRHPETATDLAHLAEQYPAVQIHPLNVGNPEAIRMTGEMFSQYPIDILINNAGIYGPSGQGNRLNDIDVPAWQEVFMVNSIAPILVSQALLGALRLGKGKTIVMMSSILGSIAANDNGGMYPYRSSKAALNSAAKGLAMDLEPEGITVLMMHPGWVKTDMGGADAAIAPQESVAGMRQVIATSTQADSGTFRDYQGQPVPW